MHPLLVAILLFLTLGSTGFAKETLSDSSSDDASSKDVIPGLSRTKRGNFRRWNRGLGMLRLGKRADDFDEGADNERDLYGLVDSDGYVLTPSVDDDVSKRSLAMLRLGKRLSSDQDDGVTDDKRTLNMLRLGKRQLGMLRLGKRTPPLSDADTDGSFYDNKRNLNMLRLGKRQMQMLRLGKREDVDDLNELGYRLDDVLGGQIRLGKRHMQMLRLGKRADDDMYPNKRNLNMLRLGKRDSDNQSTDSM